MSAARRLPNGSQISDGLNKNLSAAETTRTSTSPCSSCLTASAAVSPPKFPPSTSTFLRPMTAPPDGLARRSAWASPKYPWGYLTLGPKVPPARTARPASRCSLVRSAAATAADPASSGALTPHPVARVLSRIAPQSYYSVTFGTVGYGGRGRSAPCWICTVAAAWMPLAPGPVPVGQAVRAL